MNRNLAIGADIGGHHISCALVNLDQGIVLPGSHVRREIDNKAGADDILAGWSEALKQCLQKAGRDRLAGIGFAMPGPFDYVNGIALFTKEVVKYEHLYGVNVATRLKEILGLQDRYGMRFMNDATSFAVGEAWAGVARGVERSVCITLGTGFGSAFTTGGLPVVEGKDVPRGGCVWHLPWNGGIADDSFSTRWFVKQYAGKTGTILAGAKEIAIRAETEPLAREIFREFGTGLGEFLGPWLTKFSAEILVIGGNVAGAYDLFGNYLADSLKNQNLHVRTALSVLKEDAAILGSARLLEAGFREKITPILTKM
jgi:glucokinase